MWLTTFLSFVKAIPWRAWVFSAIALAAFLLIALAFKSYGDRRAAEVQGRWDAATAEAEQRARVTEDGWRKGITDWATQATQKRLTREREFSAIIDGLQSGNGPVRVRPRLKCSVPQAPGTASGNDGGPTGPGQPAGFQESDAVVVLRIGEDADAVASRLAQCQHYVNTVTGGYSWATRK